MVAVRPILLAEQSTLKVHVGAGIRVKSPTQIRIFDCIMDVVLHTEIVERRLPPAESADFNPIENLKL